jgi:hypothetical protein
MLIAVDPKKELAGNPEPLDDQHMVFNVRPADNPTAPTQIVVQPIDGGQRKALVDSGWTPRLLPTGQLAYVDSGTLFVVPFDIEHRAVIAAAARVSRRHRNRARATLRSRRYGDRELSNQRRYRPSR